MSMTENEAIKAIQNDLEWHSKELKPAYKEVLKMAIQALEEIPRYRDLGTVDELAEMQVQYHYLSHKIRKYEAIGTPDECRTAVERMKPKKPTEWANGTKHCPNPDCEFDNTCLWFKVCVNCGQSLDRSE